MHHSPSRMNPATLPNRNSQKSEQYVILLSVDSFVDFTDEAITAQSIIKPPSVLYGFILAHLYLRIAYFVFENY